MRDFRDDADQQVGPEVEAWQRESTQIAGQERQVGMVYEQVKKPTDPMPASSASSAPDVITSQVFKPTLGMGVLGEEGQGRDLCQFSGDWPVHLSQH
ncbi:hypothetical protein KDA_70540 [Dictyobacter alpinus]|uniref:Uncharacterized protein n=1 Tax=Dictyobacter alpinus TaxID=2014873 RepID=A0A402BJQ5_9CHLR|nr:hypothetical protein KDA_70540 [Dictyobacter alpinus]